MKVFLVKKLDNPDKVKEIIYEVENFINNKTEYQVINKEEELTSDSIVISLGGDGTMIYAAKIALKYKCKVFGFNLGNLGFLTEEFDNWKEKLTLLLIKKEYIEEKRHYMYSKVGKEKFIAINDIVISPEKSYKMLKYELEINDLIACKSVSNGVIFSTATGSTAYAKSVGGAIVEPTSKSMQIIPIAPITITTRPLLVSQKTKVVINITTCEKSLIIVDGQPVLLSDKNNNIINKVEFRMSKDTITFLHLPNYNFYTQLSKKLNWFE